MGYIMLIVTPLAWIVILSIMSQIDNVQMRKAHDKQKIQSASYFNMSLKEDAYVTPADVSRSIILRAICCLIVDIPILMFIASTWTSDPDDDTFATLYTMFLFLLLIEYGICLWKKFDHHDIMFKKYWDSVGLPFMSKVFPNNEWVRIYNDADINDIVAVEPEVIDDGFKRYTSGFLQDVIYTRNGYSAEGIRFDYRGHQTFLCNAMADSEGMPLVSGLFVCIGIHTKTKYPVHILVSKVKNEKEQKTFLTRYDEDAHRIETEDISFTNRFEVYAKDKIGGYVVIDSVTMEKLREVFENIPRGTFMVTPDSIYGFTCDLHTDVTQLKRGIFSQEKLKRFADTTYTYLDTIVQLSECF